ncbi:unnamed protein product [Rangifer tarandus platyrhynchus]|uniref:Uncharacterized protein n=2 Tax=Rangifer tarandus platyrhynchus TaxID=3082113 RepID=A0AC60A3H2_RANTA|nr:unnamed protein product [Rangifer tarandus platyrhynchus]
MRRPGILQEILNKDYEEESSSPVTPPLQDSHGFLVLFFFFALLVCSLFLVHVDWGPVFSVMTFSFHCLSVLDNLGKIVIFVVVVGFFMSYTVVCLSDPLCGMFRVFSNFDP